MAGFRNIGELATQLKIGAKLLQDMFEKRTTVGIDYSSALEFIGNENQLRSLIKRGIIEENNDMLEIAENFQHFFEDILDANETISVALVKEYIDKLKDDIKAYFLADDSTTKAKYMRSCNRDFMNIEHITKRNYIDLKRNADNTYKQENNYKIKIFHLERLDEKRHQIATLITETEKLIDDEEVFINLHADIGLRQTINDVKRGLHETTRSLIDLQKQIIVYLNKINYQSRIEKKVRLLKYLKDQIMLENSSNIKEVLEKQKAVWFEPRPQYHTKLSLAYLQDADEALKLIEDVKKQLNRKATIHERLSSPLRPEELKMQEEEMRVFDHQELMSSFEAQSNDLFKFVWQYDFRQEVSKEDRLVLFLQLASQFTEKLTFENRTCDLENITYPIINNKRH